MKNLAGKIIGSAIGLFLLCGVSIAQESDPDSEIRNRKQEMSKEQNAENLQNRARFRATLTENQINILENREMRRNEKRRAFRASLSEQQREMLRESREIRTQQRKAYRNCAVEEQRKQRQQSRENTRERSGQGR